MSLRMALSLPPTWHPQCLPGIVAEFQALFALSPSETSNHCNESQARVFFVRHHHSSFVCPARVTNSTCLWWSHCVQGVVSGSREMRSLFSSCVQFNVLRRGAGRKRGRVETDGWPSRARCSQSQPPSQGVHPSTRITGWTCVDF